MLGFGTRPIAHTLTMDTRDVLDQASSKPCVPTELTKQVLPNHTLQPGDTILLEVLDDDSTLRFPADQTVMPDGSIDLAQFGRVVVASMSPEQAEGMIQNIIATNGNESVAINVRLIQPVHRFYVVGEVNSPGSYPLKGHESVLDAIMKAGGLTDEASACDILLARPTTPCSCRVTLPVCYRSITQLGDTSTNYHLQPGDRIVVARQSKCEELFSFLPFGMDCPHCSSNVKACRGPAAAVNGISEFNPPEGNVFQPSSPPRIVQSAVGNPRVVGPQQLDSPTSGTAPPAVRTTPWNDGYDGELNFDRALSDPNNF